MHKTVELFSPRKLGIARILFIITHYLFYTAIPVVISNIILFKRSASVLLSFIPDAFASGMLRTKASPYEKDNFLWL